MPRLRRQRTEWGRPVRDDDPHAAPAPSAKPAASPGRDAGPPV